MKIKTFAAIDIGSNGIRLMINHIYENEFQPIFNKTQMVRVPIRLGHDSFTNQHISEQNIVRMISGITSYKLLMEVYNVEKYRAFATSAMREAKNADEVVKRIYESCGVEIEIIDGEKEAAIIFQTELSSFVNSNKAFLYVDVGGGSTEVTLINNGKVIDSKSFPIGTVRFLEGKVPKDYLKNEVKPWIKKITKGFKIDLIGSGGNINYVFKQSEKKEGLPLMYNYISRFYKTIKNLSYEQRIESFNMKPDRADVIVPALDIYKSIMKWSKAKQIFIPKIGVVDGMIQWMYKTEKESYKKFVKQ